MKILVKNGQAKISYNCSGYGNSGCNEKSTR